MKNQKKYINAYALISQKNDVIFRNVYSTLDELIKNLKVYLGLGYSNQVQKIRIEVPECLNVWKQC